MDLPFSLDDTFASNSLSWRKQPQRNPYRAPHPRAAESRPAQRVVAGHADTMRYYAAEVVKGMQDRLGEE